MGWKRRDWNLYTSWVHSNGDRLVIEPSEVETDYDEQRGEICTNCGCDIGFCECCELWVYSDDMGKCDSVGVAKSGSEAFKLAEDFMKKNPKGWFERVGFAQKQEQFIFR